MMRRQLLNYYAIADYVRAAGAASRAGIAEALGLPLAAAGRLVRDLLARGVLVHDGYEESSGGRRRARVRLNAARFHAIGVHLGRRGIRGALVDMGGGIVAEHADGDPAAGGVSGAIEGISRTIESLIAQHGAPDLCGIGIGVSGIIRDGGKVSREFPDAERWVDVPLADEVEKRFGRRPILLNDIHAAALGELRAGGRQGVRNLVFLHMGDGISAGIVTDGRLYAGGTRNAGEVGHIILAEDGPICYCGNRGCLESLAAPRAVVQACRDAAGRGVRTLVLEEAGTPGNITFEHVLAAAGRGDRLASNLLTDAGRHLGQVAANLINVLDPEMLVLGGVLAGPPNVLVETLIRTARARLLPVLRGAARIEMSRLGTSATVLGAGACVLDEVFADPARLLGEVS